MSTANWNRWRLERFRAIYEIAKQKELPFFEFDGETFVTKYAQYVLEYLDVELPKAGGESDD